MKKVLLCCKMPNNNSYVGGVATILQSYIQNKELFERNNVSIDIFDYQLEKKFNNLKSQVKNILYIWKQRKALAERLNNEKDVIVNIHTSREFLFLKDIYLAKMISKNYQLPVVVTIHVGDIDTVFNRIGIFKSVLINYLNLYVAKVVFLSNEIQNQFIKSGLDQNKTNVLYNFYNLIPLNDENHLNHPSKLHLLYVGAIHREKGIIDLLKALNNIKDLDFHLDLCGQLTDKSIEEEFNRLIISLGSKVTIQGYVNGIKKTALFERADVLILPSYHEGMPLVILEALSQGCAIIATKVGANPEILSDSNVIWTNIGNSTDIQNAIIKLYDSKDLLNNMKENNKKLGDEFTIEKHISLLSELYFEF